MKGGKALLNAVLVTGFALSLMFSTGCSRHPNEEQIRVLEEARAAALSAEEQLAQKQQECNDLQQKVASKEQQLAKLKKERDMVKEKLQNWKSE